MVQPSPLREKSYSIALIIVDICRDLQKQKEFVMSKQLLKSGTSIGANLEEAKYAQSRPDFISKCSIALKEASETHYWIRLLCDKDYLSSQKVAQLLKELQEVIAMLASTIKTTKSGIH